MSSWQQFADDAPDLAAMVQARFESTGLGFLATIRKDGSPRISGIEPSVFRGELWLGMMDRSRKGDDLKRDPRLALQIAVPVRIAHKPHLATDRRQSAIGIINSQI